jgi:hypothetical protein
MPTKAELQDMRAAPSRKGKAAMRQIVMFVLAFGLVGAASAGTITLRGLYARSALGADCINAGGTPTPGTGAGGFGCKTDKGEVECTDRGQCIGTCPTCGTRHHRTGVYGILHAGMKQ